MQDAPSSPSLSVCDALIDTRPSSRGWLRCCPSVMTSSKVGSFVPIFWPFLLTPDQEVSGQHRLSLGSTASSLPARQSHARTNSHSHPMPGASGNPTYRVTRRKSMSSTAANNVAAIAAAVRGGAGDLGGGGSRRSMKLALNSKTSQYGTSPSPSGSLPNGAASFGQSGFASVPKEGTAVVDGPPLATMSESKANAKARIRRASEGSRLSKGEGKRMSAGELRCDKCGKGYKHSSCLTKHLSVPSGRARPLPSHALSVPLVV